MGQAKINFLWKNGILECWNIGSKIGINLFKLFKNPSNPLFHHPFIPYSKQTFNLSKALYISIKM
jgi:hypothetical protein